MQCDMIGLSNRGVPDKIILVPNILIRRLPNHLHRDLSKTFRFTTLMIGLYLKGKDTMQKDFI